MKQALTTLAFLMIAVRLTAADIISLPETIGTQDFFLSLRLANHNNAPHKKYKTMEGKSVSYPGYSLQFLGNDTLSISFKTKETESRAVVEVMAQRGDELGRMEAYRGVNPYTDSNVVNIERRGEDWIFEIGEEQLTWQLPDFRVDSVALVDCPGAAAEVYSTRLRITSKGASALLTPWTSEESLRERFRSRKEGLEGFWRIHDRSLDEELLRMGGNYRLAAVRTPEGYDFIYLEGAKTLQQDWQPGMLKLRLKDTGVDGVYDAIWYDAEQQPLEHEIKAQVESRGLISVFFPYQNSQIRLALVP